MNEKTKISTRLAAIAGLAVAASSVNAAATFIGVDSPGGPTTPGGVGELLYAPDVSNTDLLHGLSGVEGGAPWDAPASRTNDGVHGGSFDQGAGLTGIAFPRIGSNVTFTLGAGANGLGFDITSIQTIAAWQSAGFGNQGYMVDARPLGGSFALLASVSYTAIGSNAAGATKVTITDDGLGPGGILATGIDAIRFTQTDLGVASVGGRSTYREFDVFGTDTAAVPEPSSAVLVLLGSLLLGRRSRA